MINYIVSESTVGGGGAFLPDFTLRVEAVCSPALLLQLHGANTFSPQQNPIKGTITSWTILQICLRSSLIMKFVVKAWMSDYPQQTRTQFCLSGILCSWLRSQLQTCASWGNLVQSHTQNQTHNPCYLLINKLAGLGVFPHYAATMCSVFPPASSGAKPAKPAKGGCLLYNVSLNWSNEKNWIIISHRPLVYF